jgi:hypothetical protein
MDVEFGQPDGYQILFLIIYQQLNSKKMETLVVEQPQGVCQNKNSAGSLETDLSLNDLSEREKVNQVYKDMIFVVDYNIET